MRKYRPRIHYTEADKALMWDRWQQGESLHAIAHLFDRYHHSVRRTWPRQVVFVHHREDAPGTP